MKQVLLFNLNLNLFYKLFLLRSSKLPWALCDVECCWHLVSCSEQRSCVYLVLLANAAYFYSWTFETKFILWFSSSFAAAGETFLYFPSIYYLNNDTYYFWLQTCSVLNPPWLLLFSPDLQDSRASWKVSKTFTLTSWTTGVIPGWKIGSSCQDPCPLCVFVYLMLSSSR